MWYPFCMHIQRTITLVIEADPDLEATLEAFREVQHNLSEPCYHDGNPLGALALQRAYYHTVKGTLKAQMTIYAIRLVVGVDHAAKSNLKPATRPLLFIKARALFNIGVCCCDADCQS